MNTSIGADSRLGNVILIAGVFAALVAALIALSAADPNKLLVRYEIDASIDKEEKPAKCKKENLTDELKRFYENFPDPITSYKVNFKIINTSGFTWKHPVLTFRLPMANLHPDEAHPGRQAFNSNIYNFPVEFRQFQFQDTLILSNSNLPYWNDKENLTFWIRMAIHENLEPNIVVSVNCDNAEGVNNMVEIYLKNSQNMADSQI